MDKAGQTLASSSLSLPLATLCILTHAQSESALLDCLSAPFKSRPLPPPHVLPHYWLTRPPPPLCSPHSLTPTLSPPSPLSNQAQGGLVMQLERMFFIWTHPHTSVPVDPPALYPDQSQCAISSCLIITWSAFFFFQYKSRITFLSIATQHCQNLQVIPCVTAFCSHFWSYRFHRGGWCHCDV